MRLSESVDRSDLPVMMDATTGTLGPLSCIPDRRDGFCWNIGTVSPESGGGESSESEGWVYLFCVDIPDSPVCLNRSVAVNRSSGSPSIHKLIVIEETSLFNAVILIRARVRTSGRVRGFYIVSISALI